MVRLKETTYGQRGGEGPTAGKKSRTFICTHPMLDQPKKKKRVFDLPASAKPTALWYYSDRSGWCLNTVVDLNNLPDWSKNYTRTPAVEVVS